MKETTLIKQIRQIFRS